VALFVATFTVDGIPQPKGSMKMLPRGRRSDGSVKWVLGSDNDALEAWEQAIIWTARSHRPRTPLTGPVAMVVEFRFPVLKNAPKRRQLPMTSKPDLSKLLRGIEDGLSGMFYVDDAQITDCHVKKRRAYDGAPGVTITVSETDGLS
jgi:Holliday junction resolvase RusA-like endonuclease